MRCANSLLSKSSAENVGLRIDLHDPGATDILVADAGGMPQKILDVHGSIRRHELQDGIAVVCSGLDSHLHVGEGRDKFGHRIGQRQPAIIDQHHRRDAGNRLRHRMKRKDRVRRHGLLRGDIPNAEALEIDRSTVLLDQHDRAGKLSGRDLVRKEFGQTFQSRRRRRGSARLSLYARDHCAAGYCQGSSGQGSRDVRYH